MTSVNITSTENTVAVAENSKTTVVTVPQSTVISTVVQGPQGPQGLQGPAGSLDSIGEIPDISIVAKVNKSLLYYDAASEKFKADATVTTTTVTDGGSY